MKTWKINITGGHNDTTWSGTVEAADGHAAKVAGRQAACEEGFIAGRHSDTFVTFVNPCGCHVHTALRGG